jgi:hypothetical protein
MKGDFLGLKEETIAKGGINPPDKEYFYAGRILFYRAIDLGDFMQFQEGVETGLRETGYPAGLFDVSCHHSHQVLQILLFR